MKYVRDKARLTYVVEFFKALLFDKVSIICRDDVERTQVVVCTEGLESFVDIVCFENSKGTYDTLRQMVPSIKSDCIVVTSNFNLHLNLHDIANVYRRKECACLFVLEQLKDHTTAKDGANPVYGITSDHHIISYADLLSRSNSLNIPHSLLIDYPSFCLYTNLHDCECYFMSKVMLQLLDTVQAIDDFKADFLSVMIRRQHYYMLDTKYTSMRDIIKSEANAHIFRSSRELVIRAYLL
ncbi:uncharacterized protein [Blastocystis hominis]|uniref:Translation initiation factor eIF2B subunit gamma n=1 Tax=Blastocystis hominis TaxID=12968 RepID=D8LVG0_BLAHO|nr:uncharacterized protein [Blastocystis hominis]CBK19799.2 unnamed protein product [Blastocystis hominis]|eukprot:XP_012893847.1 uncharacterized protein [Blastocystis hominis]